MCRVDMAKLMIGSFGTLAAIAVVNFKLARFRLSTRTFRSLASNIGGSDCYTRSHPRSVLQPSALDLVNPAAAARLGPGWVLRAVAGRG